MSRNLQAQAADGPLVQRIPRSRHRLTAAEAERGRRARAARVVLERRDRQQQLDARRAWLRVNARLWRELQAAEEHGSAKDVDRAREAWLVSERCQPPDPRLRGRRR